MILSARVSISKSREPHNIQNQDFVNFLSFFFRRFRGKDRTSTEASGGHPVQSQRRGGPTPRPDVLDATRHQPVAATPGGRKSERRPLH